MNAAALSGLAVLTFPLILNYNTERGLAQSSPCDLITYNDYDLSDLSLNSNYH